MSQVCCLQVSHMFIPFSEAVFGVLEINVINTLIVSAFSSKQDESTNS